MSRPTLVVPRGAEAAAIRRARPAGTIVEIAPGAAARGLAATLPPHAPVLVLGLCGALRERRAGDIVVYGSVRDERGTFACRPLLDDRALLGTAVHVVRACTADHVVTTVAERSALAARYDADVVDMEGTYIAAALAERAIPCTMLRVVSDDARRDLPALRDAIRADGRLAVMRIAAAFAQDPRGAAAFVRDVRAALRTLTAIAAAVSRTPR